MIEFELDDALHALSGVAESLHAAGIDVCVPAHDDPAESGEGDDVQQ